MTEGAFGLALLAALAEAVSATRASPETRTVPAGWTGASIGLHAGGLSGDFFVDYNSADASSSRRSKGGSRCLACRVNTFSSSTFRW
jgi:hypothetical protein